MWKVRVYACELEAQPEFSQFKDWCTTVKLYSGKKTGIPEKDEQLYCGFLKAGIAIYRWPPPKDTTAVSCTGVELNYGFFTDYPDNVSSKFLVRVYVVKGLNLIPKAFTVKLGPYVAISCGSKHLGDRKNHVKNTQNPIFGKIGPNKWRDCEKPSVILESLCEKYHLAPPIFPDDATVVVNGVEYRDNDSNGKSEKMLGV